MRHVTLNLSALIVPFSGQDSVAAPMIPCIFLLLVNGDGRYPSETPGGLAEPWRGRDFVLMLRGQ